MSLTRNELPVVLVTGAAGSLARRVIARLQGKCAIVAADFRRRVETDAGIASYRIDMQQGGFEPIFRRHRIDAVLHLGRIFSHEATRLKRYSANVLGTRRLLELCRTHGVGQVLIHSTYYVYGASPYNPALLREDAPLKASELSDELVDAVELENLAQIWLWKHPEMRLMVLRPCNILGPDVRNSMSQLLSGRWAPLIAGYAPMMQFLHVDDMAEAIDHAYQLGASGVYNVAPDDCLPYNRALKLAGCRAVPLPPVPEAAPALIGRLLRWGGVFPPHLINYFKHPVVLDGNEFRRRSGWQPRHDSRQLLGYYRRAKQRLGH